MNLFKRLFGGEPDPRQEERLKAKETQVRAMKGFAEATGDDDLKEYAEERLEEISLERRADVALDARRGRDE